MSAAAIAEARGSSGDTATFVEEFIRSEETAGRDEVDSSCRNPESVVGEVPKPPLMGLGCEESDGFRRSEQKLGAVRGCYMFTGWLPGGLHRPSLLGWASTIHGLEGGDALRTFADSITCGINLLFTTIILIVSSGDSA